MANNYVQFSENLLIHSAEEEAWLGRQLEEVSFAASSRTVYEREEDVPSGMEYEEVPRFVAEAVQRGELDEVYDMGFDYQFETGDDGKGELSLYTVESGDLDQVAILVQQFLKQFAPQDWWSLTWAATCSKPRRGEFSGGGLLVTAEKILSADAQSWLEVRQAELSLTAQRMR